MVMLIDFTGFLVICALIYQGYIEGLQFRPSLMVASLFSVILFACFFTSVYTFAMAFIPYSIVSGLLTVILLNSVCIFFFYKFFSWLIELLQTRFFMPQVSHKVKKIGGMIIGACVGYIFVAGMITSFEQAMFYKKRKHTHLVHSLFYKSHNEKNSYNIPKKIDNIPALQQLYAEPNVEKFQFTEGELLAIMKCIREISNEEAKIILNQINSKEKIGIIYLNLISMYSSKTEVSQKYFIPKEEIEALQAKIEEVNATQGIKPSKKTIDSVLENI